jgi:adenosine deaminase
MPFDQAWQRFHIVIELLQTAESLRRAAREAVEDLAADGVVYGELRFAPLSHLRGGLSPDDVLEAVTTGLAEGEQLTGCVARTIVCGLRENDPEESVAAAELAVAWHGRGVVGFDLAGNEFDFRADAHAAAYAIARSGGVGVTVHAGEMAGPESIAEAIAAAQPTRIGHGLHLIDDCQVEGGRIVGLGDTARAVRQAGLMLEVCVTSNSCLGTPVRSHPVRMYRDAGFRLSVNPDDRAITTTTVAREYELWREIHGFTDQEFAEINADAVSAAFCDDETKARLSRVVAAGWLTSAG